MFRFYDFDHGLEKSIEKIDDRFRIGLGRARGESAKIEKEEGDDLIGATETRITGVSAKINAGMQPSHATLEMAKAIHGK